MKAEEFIEKVKVGGFDQEEYVGIADTMEAVKIAHNDAVKKWTLWCFNYQTPFEATICSIWGGTLSTDGQYRCTDNYFTQHMIEKWQKTENMSFVRMIQFYLELDNNNRDKLVDWVMKNYRG